ncbi:acyltransferase family protein [uncultured Sphingomonas sp.]|uniref:acyltransferase family protein n=1 Tax=uncultured Sphingomonas sp. TaxID=158754 RepID=UPI0035CAB3A8
MTRPVGELRALTGARGIAAWFVVLFHIRQSIAGLPPAIALLFSKGYLAVDFFFLLSGFVMWLSWGERLHRERWHAIVPFLRKRIARVWPLHVVMLSAMVALALVFVATGRADPVSFPFADLPLHVLLLQNWGFVDRLAWNIPSWSISAELGAYLVFPVVAIMIDWRRLPTTALLALVGILTIGLCVVIRPSPLLSFDIPRFGLIRCLCEFLTGTIVCALWQRSDGVCVAGVTAIGVAASWAIGVPETLAAPALFALLIYLLAHAAIDSPLGGRGVHFLGEVSYATYLCHYPLWIVFKLIFVRRVDDVPPALIAVYIGIVLICSRILHVRVERPAQRFIDGLAPSMKQARALP